MRLPKETVFMILYLLFDISTPFEYSKKLENDLCTTHDGAQGRCIRASKCALIVSAAIKAKQHPNICGFIDKEPIVCCAQVSDSLFLQQQSSSNYNTNQKLPNTDGNPLRTPENSATTKLANSFTIEKSGVKNNTVKYSNHWLLSPTSLDTSLHHPDTSYEQTPSTNHVISHEQNIVIENSVSRERISTSNNVTSYVQNPASENSNKYLNIWSLKQPEAYSISTNHNTNSQIMNISDKKYLKQELPWSVPSTFSGPAAPSNLEMKKSSKYGANTYSDSWPLTKLPAMSGPNTASKLSTLDDPSSQNNQNKYFNHWPWNDPSAFNKPIKTPNQFQLESPSLSSNANKHLNHWPWNDASAFNGPIQSSNHAAVSTPNLALNEQQQVINNQTNSYNQKPFVKPSTSSNANKYSNHWPWNDPSAFKEPIKSSNYTAVTTPNVALNGQQQGISNQMNSYNQKPFVKPSMSSNANKYLNHWPWNDPSAFKEPIKSSDHTAVSTSNLAVTEHQQAINNQMDSYNNIPFIKPSTINKPVIYSNEWPVNEQNTSPTAQYPLQPSKTNVFVSQPQVDKTVEENNQNSQYSGWILEDIKKDTIVTQPINNANEWLSHQNTVQIQKNPPKYSSYPTTQSSKINSELEISNEFEGYDKIDVRFNTYGANTFESTTDNPNQLSPNKTMSQIISHDTSNNSNNTIINSPTATKPDLDTTNGETIIEETNHLLNKTKELCQNRYGDQGFCTKSSKCSKVLPTLKGGKSPSVCDFKSDDELIVCCLAEYEDENSGKLETIKQPENVCSDSEFEDLNALPTEISIGNQKPGKASEIQTTHLRSDPSS